MESWRTDKRKTAERGYGARWQRERAHYLRLHPLCVMCAPRAVPARVVDHKTPHKGDSLLFWDRSNWAGLCLTHHNAHKQSFEKTGVVRGCGEDGRPVDKGHHWNK
jgi:5-methylcytosine-specific restriction protein A